MHEKESQVSNGEKKRKRKLFLTKQKEKSKFKRIQKKNNQKNNGYKKE